MKIITITLLLILTIFQNIYSQNFWEKTSAPDNVTTYSLAINSNGDIFAGAYISGETVGVNDGVYRSTDNGDNWSKLGLSSSYEAHSIFIRPNGDILIGTWQQPSGPHYLFRSTNNGNSWDTLGVINLITSIGINSSGHIFVGTNSQGIFRSVDNGVNWIAKNQGLNGDSIAIKSLLVHPNGNIFAGTIFGGVFRSTDNGENWVSTSQGLTSIHILSLAVNPSGNIFAGTEGSGVFRSTNNGESWAQINQGLAGEGLYVLSIAINSGGTIFAGTAAGVFRSIDNGVNWVSINQGLTNTNVYSLAINSNGVLFAGTGGGIFRSVISANIKVYLQGPYSGGSMTTTLNTNSLIPLNSNTAYSTVTYGYTASTVGSIPNANIVDWVLVELRTGTAAGTKIATRAAFLKSDGTIVDVDGTSPVIFAGLGDGNYYIVVRHRNHLAIMSASAITLSSSSALYDFSSAQLQAYGTNPMVALSGGGYGMWMSDTDASGVVDVTDRANTWNLRNTAGVYNGYDTDLSSVIDVTDRANTWNNRNRQTQVPN